MKKSVKKMISAITFPFSVISVLIDDSRNINENGDWDRYHARKNHKKGVQR